MPVAVQSVGTFNATAGTSLAVTFSAGSPVTAGNRLVVLAMALGGSATTTVFSATDTLGTSYSPIAATLTTHSTALFRCQVLLSGLIPSSGADTVTLALSLSANERILIVAEVSGLSGATGGAASATGIGANPTTNATIVDVTSLMIGGMATGGSGTQGTGYSLLSTQDGNVGQYRIPAGTGAQAFSFTQVSADYALFGSELRADTGISGSSSATAPAVAGEFSPHLNYRMWL